MNRLLILAAAALVLAPLCAYQMEPDFFQVSEEVVTPHITRAKPYARGKVRALFIVPRYSVREVIELAQRMDLDYTVAETLSHDELGWTSASGPYANTDGASLEEAATDLGRKLQGNYDVIVVGIIKWDMLPREHLYTLMEKVSNGTGLVRAYQKYGRNALVDRLFAKPAVGGDAVSSMLAGVPLAALPVLNKMKPEEILELRQFREGRMALLNYPGRPDFECLTPLLPDPPSPLWSDLYYDYYQSLVIRAILWAAKKEPAVTLTAFGLATPTVDRGALATTPLKVGVAGVAGDLQATFTVRDSANAVYVNVTQPVKDGAAQTVLPPLPAGKYLADVILRSGQATANWASSAFEVTSPLNIASLTLDKPSIAPEESVTVTVGLSQPAPSATKLVVNAVDSTGREMARTVVAIPTGQRTVAAALRVTAPLSRYARITAYLAPTATGPRPVWQAAIATARADLYVRLQRSRANYAHAVWSAASNTNSRLRELQMQQLEACGVDMHTNGPTTLPGHTWLARHNMDNIPYATRYSYDDKELVRNPCLTDPKFLEPHLAGLTKIGAELGAYAPRAYTLGDECFLARGGVDVCFSPTCTADLREWLKTQYADVAALNASWGTTYQSMDDAEPITLADAKKLGQPARWVDHRRHMEFVYARMMERAKQAIRQGDPQAEVGFDGPFETDSTSGNDWWQLMQAFTMCNVYFHQPTQWEFLRSFAKPNMLLGLWYGGYFEHRTEDEERLWPWKGILNGFNSMWWYAVQHGSKVLCPMDAIAPSGTVYPAFRWASEEMRELRAGAGQALMAATRDDCGIGVHYSQASLHASAWDPSWGRLDTTWLQTFGTLEDMGLQYTCYAYAQIEKPGIDPKRFRVFILPYSQAISPAEAAALRKYVADGGLLLADVRPGVCDQHGKPQSPGLLDDLFGIKRVPGKGVQKNQTGTIEHALIAGGKRLELTRLDVDGDVQVADGQALGKAGDMPIVITKTTGQGRAALLNYSFGAPYTLRLAPEALPHWQVLADLMATKSVKPPARVTASGGPLRHVETVVFHGPAVDYVGFLKYRNSAGEQPVMATVTMDKKLHTYDMRTGQYLGNVAQWQTEFTPARAKLFARLPYQLQGLAVSMRPARVEAAAGQAAPPRYGCQISLATNGGAAAQHWVELEVFGPDGQPRPCYARNVPLTQGAAASTFQFALNDPPGQWKIVARDSISHKTATAAFRLP